MKIYTKKDLYVMKRCPSSASFSDCSSIEWHKTPKGTIYTNNVYEIKYGFVVMDKELDRDVFINKKDAKIIPEEV